MKIVKIFIFFLGFTTQEAKKTFPKRSTTVQRKDYFSSYEITDDNVISTPVYAHKLPENLRIRAAEELLYMFGLQVPRKVGHIYSTKPPKYMVDLYKAVANSDGSTKFPDRMNAETVRSVPNKDPNCPDRCEFILNALDDRETITDAELHIFLHKARSYAISSNTYVLKVFQVISTRSVKMKKVLIAARHLPTQLCGWQIFPFLTTITTWMKTKDRRLSLSIELTHRNGDVIQQQPSSKDKQPIIVTFSNDRRILQKYTVSSKMSTNSKELFRKKRRRSVEQKFRHVRAIDETNVKKRNSNKKERNHNKTTSELKKPSEFQHHQWNESIHSNEDTHYHKRSSSVYDQDKKEKKSKTFLADKAERDNHYSPQKSSFSKFSSSSSAMKMCQRYPLYVDFEEMGWSGWIIFPHGYNAYHCKGKCSFPLSKHLKPSSHATVQSIMHVLGLGGQPVELPCCAPDTLYDINLLYFDQNDNAVLQRYKEMVAGSCTCR